MARALVNKNSSKSTSKKGPGPSLKIPAPTTVRKGGLSVKMGGGGTFSKEAGTGGLGGSVSAPIVAKKKVSISGGLNFGGGGGYKKNEGRGMGGNISPTATVTYTIGSKKKKK